MSPTFISLFCCLENKGGERKSALTEKSLDFFSFLASHALTKVTYILFHIRKGAVVPDNSLKL